MSLTSIRSWFEPLIQSVKANPGLIFLCRLLLVVLIPAFVAVMFFEIAEEWIGRLLGLSDKNKTLTYLGAGISFILPFVIANRRAKAPEDTANAQARATEEQAKANQKTELGQPQDHLKNAIEHLGHESDSVRLGGAYELFHLAKDTEEFRQTVLDVLCMHIRRTTGEIKYRRMYPFCPSEEVQSLLTLLFVQEHEVFKGCQIDLSGSCLNNAILRKARLRGAILDSTYLRWAHLNGAQLQGARLAGTHLSAAFLHSACLQGTILLMTRLEGAQLEGACLQGAIVKETHLQEADLYDAQMQGVKGLEFSGMDWISMGFADRINMLVDKKSDLSNAIFAGGLTREDVDSILKIFPVEEEASKLQERLNRHIDAPVSNQLPENSDAVTGSYTKDEAEKWIAEY